MDCEMDKGFLTIKIRHNDLKKLPKSKSGKTFIVASTGGNLPTTLAVNGSPVVVGVNAYVKG